MKQQPTGGMRALTPFLFAAILWFAGTTTASHAHPPRTTLQALEYALGVSQSSFSFDRAAFYLDYNIYEKGTNGPLLRGETRNYFGLTRLGIAVSYDIK